jgi:hypothetical protein
MRAAAISCGVFRDALWRSKPHLLVQRSLAEHEQPAQSRVQPGPSSGAHPAMIEGHDLECRGKGSDLCH